MIPCSSRNLLNNSVTCWFIRVQELLLRIVVLHSVPGSKRAAVQPSSLFKVAQRSSTLLSYIGAGGCATLRAGCNSSRLQSTKESMLPWAGDPHGKQGKYPTRSRKDDSVEMFGTAQPTRELHFLLSSRRTPRRGTDRSQVRRQFPFRRLATPHFKGCPASSFHTYCGRLKGARAQPAAPERDPFIPPPFPASIMHLDLLGPPLASAPNDQRLAPHLAHIQRFDQIALRQLRVPRLTRAAASGGGEGGRASALAHTVAVLLACDAAIGSAASALWRSGRAGPIGRSDSSRMRRDSSSLALMAALRAGAESA
eukprot:CAMPEP_0182846068 /NCGR_PEP_ID=MMETSP0006_2-20121128/27684_1 /TAXON_ID=97485 /ORGANISM="Prymnesium parvum, Strain Texoma1" /LENGTH=310 /DNA_ID=CAMNT_0024976223 /DNA_START=26 /DNA_END=957 /DNA_ORIENTATION=+